VPTSFYIFLVAPGDDDRAADGLEKGHEYFRTFEEKSEPPGRVKNGFSPFSS
jgi:hypothetical protein